MISKEVFFDHFPDRQEDCKPYLREAVQSISERFSEDIFSFRLLGVNTFVEMWNRFFVSYTKEEKRVIATAYVLAEYAHVHQQRRQRDRKTGLPIPYIQHVLAVTREVAEHDQQSWVIAAALGHDIFEDSPRYRHPVTKYDIKYFFPSDAERIVSTIEALTEVQQSERGDPSVETLRKIIERGLENPAVVLIKTCDRLHNMRTIAAMPREKQERKAAETYMIYAPLAQRFGFSEYARELYERSIKILNIHRGGRSLNKRIAQSIEALVSHVNTNHLLQEIHNIYAIYGGIQVVSLRYPLFHEVYDSVLLRYINRFSDTLLSEWEVTTADLPMRLDLVIRDDILDPTMTSEERVAWAEDRLRAILPLAMDSLVQLPTNRIVGLYDLIYQARRGVFQEETVFSLVLSDGTPIRVYVCSEIDYTKKQIPLSILTKRDSDKASMDLAQKKIREIHRQYEEWISREISYDTIRYFGNVLHGSVPVFISYDGNDASLRETHQPIQATIADILFQHEDWMRVQEITINGKVIDLTTDLGMRVPAGGNIVIRMHDKDDKDAIMLIHPSFADHLCLRQYKRQNVLSDIKRIYLSLSDTDPRREEYRRMIVAYGWNRLVEPIRNQIVPFNLMLVLPKKYSSSEEFLLRLSFGEINKHEIEAIRRRMIEYCASLHRIQVQVKDLPGIKKQIIDIFYPSGQETGVPNLIHDTIDRPYGGDTPVLTFYFDPNDPHIGKLSEIIEKIQRIGGVMSVRILS